MPRLIFLNRYFYPDHSATSQMLSDLAFALGDDLMRGDEPVRVHVVTSRSRYDDPDQRLSAFETVQGVDVRRVWTSRFGRANLAGRMIDYVTFYFSAAWTLFWLARRGDIIVAKTDPPMLSIVAAPIARLRGARLVNWLQDIFPEVAQALGVGNGALSRLALLPLRVLRNISLRRADANVVIGEKMAARLSELSVSSKRICVIANWASGALIKPVGAKDNALRAEWGFEDKFVVGYSGNLGRAHDIDTMLGAMAALEKRNVFEIAWLFVGGGALHNTLNDKAAALGITSLVFQPYQPFERLAESLSVPDVHLVSLRPELEGLIVPSKFYGIAAAGRATLFVGDPGGEIARLVEQFDCGRSVREGDADGLAAAVEAFSNDRAMAREMGKNARRAFEASFDKPIAVARWRALLVGLWEAEERGPR